MSDPREGEEFFLNVPEKLDNPFPDLAYFREHRPVFYYPPLQTWFVFRYDDVAMLFQDARLSADRRQGFVDAAPAGVRDELRMVAPAFERWVLMKDGVDHSQLRHFLNRGFNATVVQSLRGLIQESVDELLDRRQDQGHIDAIASANRDSAHFPEAERFDISRAPGKHLSFGHGPHGCLGASLAREQASIALTTLFQRWPGLRLDPSQPIQWYRNAGNRGPITLPLVLEG
jgi:cytochrome P450